MATHATHPQRWPRTAEAQRQQIHQAACDVREVLSEALKTSLTTQARLLIAMAVARTADIQRLSIEARVGPEGTPQ
jgi:hypothetical protein